MFVIAVPSLRAPRGKGLTLAIKIQFKLSSEKLKERTARSFASNLATKISGVVIQMVTMLVLARLLTPGDFGLVGMVMPLIAIFTIFGGLGLSNAVLQKEEITREQLSALFYLNVFVSLGVAAATFAAAPLLAAFYKAPEVIPITAIFCTVIVTSGISILQMNLLQRSMRFDILLIAEVTSQLISSGIAIWMAMTGWGYLALAWRAATQPVIFTVIIWSFSDWFPGRPVWDGETTWMMKFGAYSTGFSLLNSLGRQMDNVLIGWRYGQVELGPYALAYRLFFVPVQIVTQPIGAVMITSLSRLRDEPERMERWYLLVLRILALCAFPPLFMAAVCAKDLVDVVVGSQWSAVTPIIRWLLPVGAIHVTYTTIGWLMVVTGRADRQFRWSLLTVPLCILSFVIGLPWKAEGVAIAYVITNVLLFIPGFMYGIYGTNITLKQILIAHLPGVCTTVAVCALAAAVLHLEFTNSSILRLVFCGLLVVLGLIVGSFWTFGLEAIKSRVGFALSLIGIGKQANG